MRRPRSRRRSGAPLAWQMATASASAAWSGRGSSVSASSVWTMRWTWRLVRAAGAADRALDLLGRVGEARQPALAGGEDRRRRAPGRPRTPSGRSRRSTGPRPRARRAAYSSSSAHTRAWIAASRAPGSAPAARLDHAAVERDEPRAVARHHAVAGVGGAGIDAEDDHSDQGFCAPARTPSPGHRPGNSARGAPGRRLSARSTSGGARMPSSDHPPPLPRRRRRRHRAASPSPARRHGAGPSAGRGRAVRILHFTDAHVTPDIPRSEPLDQAGARSSASRYRPDLDPPGRRRDLRRALRRQGDTSTAVGSRIAGSTRTRPHAGRPCGRQPRLLDRARLDRRPRRRQGPDAARARPRARLLRAAARRLEADRARLDRAHRRRRVRRPARRRADGVAAARSSASHAALDPRRDRLAHPDPDRAAVHRRVAARRTTTPSSSPRGWGVHSDLPELNDAVPRPPERPARAERPQPRPRRHHLQHRRASRCGGAVSGNWWDEADPGYRDTPPASRSSTCTATARPRSASCRTARSAQLEVSADGPARASTGAATRRRR